MRASLLANATAATLRCVREVSCASQALRPEDCFVRCWYDRACALHEQSSQVRVPTFADTEQLLLATGGVFARNDPIQAANSRPL